MNKPQREPTPEGIVDIHGKQYLTVAYRINQFRNDHPDWTIKTKCQSAGEMVRFKAIISNEKGAVMATGHAEEVRGSTNINKTSSAENCETSAVGRALAFLGYAGTEIASADEIAAALEQQKEMEQVERIKTHMGAVKDNLPTVMAIKHALAEDHYFGAYEAWDELDDETKAALTLAPTKGGVWYTDEYKKFRSNEWTAARKQFHGIEDNDNEQA